MLGKGVRPDPRLTQGNDAKFFSQSGLEACMMGAAGAVVGLLAGGKNKGTAAVVGAVAACGVAMGANYYLDVRRGQYQNTSDQLKAMGDDIKTDTQKVQARSNSIKAVMADDKRKLRGSSPTLRPRPAIRPPRRGNSRRSTPTSASSRRI